MAAPSDAAVQTELLSGLDSDEMSTTTGTSPIPTAESGATRASLRLPCFEMLGIANPRPDSPRNDESTISYACSGAARSEKPVISPPRRLLESPASTSCDRSLVPIAAHVLATLTPPCEHNNVLWSSTPSGTQHASVLLGVNSMAASERPISRSDSFITPNATPRGDAASSDISLQSDHDQWLGDALEALLLHPNTSSSSGSTRRILSHALPCPSIDGHIFTRLMTTIYEHSSSRSVTWINVFHALPERFNLRELPRSPPTTPGQPFQGEDYFTQKVFDSAVTVTDYQSDLNVLPRSPRPAVPPGSIDMAVVERYIPPTSALEVATMFDPSAPSILVDRLIELSPDNGSLLFIYPTKAGARTFVQQYLNPILDPLLRSLAMLNSLPMAFCEAIGRSPAVDHVPTHPEAHAQALQLCEKLSDHPTPLPTITTPRYELAYAASGSVYPSRRIWAEDWWTKQEKVRLRNEVTRWAQEAAQQRKQEPTITERSIAPAELLRQLLDGIAKRPYPAGQQPRSGIEVNIFVLRRTQ